MNWVRIAFYILLGLLLTGFFTFQYHELITGLLALIIGVVSLVESVRR